ALISSIILANLLSPANYGLYADLMAWGLILSSVITMGLPSALSKIISEKKINDPRSNGSIILIAFILTGMHGIAIFIFNLLISNFFVAFLYFQPMIEVLFVLVGIRLLFSGPSLVSNGILTGFREIKMIALIMSIGYVLRIPLILACIFAWDIVGAFLAEIFTNAFFLSLLILTIWRLWKNDELQHDKNQIKTSIRQIYALAIPIFLTVVFPLIANWLGYRVLGFFYSEVEIGIFQVALNLVNLVLIIPTAIVAPFLPQITEYFQVNQEKFKHSIRSVSKFTSLLLFPVLMGICFLSPILIAIFYPKYYSLATFSAIFILISYSYTVAMLVIYLQVLIATTSSTRIIMFEAIKSAIQVIMIFLLVPSLGLFGLSISFLFAALVQYLVYAFFFSVRFKTRIYYPLIFLMTFMIISCLYSFPFTIFLFQNLQYSLILGILVAIFSLIFSFFLIWKDVACRQYVINLSRIFKKEEKSD
ncbi:MAG: oligosaccharide flippase family protein, partial [Candidatus Helarchaeales archaeon]